MHKIQEHSYIVRSVCVITQIAMELGVGELCDIGDYDLELSRWSTSSGLKNVPNPQIVFERTEWWERHALPNVIWSPEQHHYLTD